MPVANPVALISVTASGTTSAVIAVPLWGYEEAQFGRSRFIGKNARVHSIVLRETAGSLATIANVRLVTKRFPVANGMVFSSVPDENLAFDATGIPLVASATVASLNTVFPNQPIAQDSLALLLDVTASGAWTIVGHVGVEL